MSKIPYKVITLKMTPDDHAVIMQAAKSYNVEIKDFIELALKRIAENLKKDADNA